MVNKDMINENIKRFRKFIGISQRELGRRINMSGQYIAKIEKNERIPPIDTVKKIAEALDVELIEILNRPKLIIELYLEYISDNNISVQKIINDTNLNISTIESTFIDYVDKPYYVEPLILIGKSLGFEGSFCINRISFDSVTKETISDLDINILKKDINFKVLNWINYIKELDRIGKAIEQTEIRNKETYKRLYENISDLIENYSEYIVPEYEGPEEYFDEIQMFISNFDGKEINTSQSKFIELGEKMINDIEQYKLMRVLYFLREISRN